MDRKKSQSYNFCFEALPAIFHSQTKDFFKYIDRDGLKFIQFWWNHVATRLPEEMLIPFVNASIELLTVGEKTRVVVLGLPHPRSDGDVYYAGLIRNPERRFAWVRLPTTRIIALVRRSKEEFATGTEIGDITPRGSFVSLGEGPEPTKDKFKEALLVYAKTAAERA